MSLSLFINLLNAPKQGVSTKQVTNLVKAQAESGRNRAPSEAADTRGLHPQPSATTSTTNTTTAILPRDCYAHHYCSRRYYY